MMSMKGARGDGGDSGTGRECIYRFSDTDTLRLNQYPDDSWGFGYRQWSNDDHVPEEEWREGWLDRLWDRAKNGYYLWVSDRTFEGTGVPGQRPSNASPWSQPVLVAYVPRDEKMMKEVAKCIRKGSTLGLRVTYEDMLDC